MAATRRISRQKILEALRDYYAGDFVTEIANRYDFHHSLIFYYIRRHPDLVAEAKRTS